MALLAMAIPILPGKTDQWRRFMGEINGERRADYVANRRQLGIHERTFFQSAPIGSSANNSPLLSCAPKA